MQFRRDRLEQPVLGEQPERLLGRARSQHLVVLLDQPRRRGVGNAVPVLADGLDDRRIEAEAEPRGKRDGAEHPHRIFLEALAGIADRSDQPVAQILQAADVVDDRKRRDVVEERVDREVAAERVFFRRAERVVVADQQIGRRRLDLAFAGGSVVAGSFSVPGRMWRRNVATSIVLLPKRTCARRNRRPMIQQFRKSFLI